MKISEESQVFKVVESAIGYEEAVKHLAIAAKSMHVEELYFIEEFDPTLDSAFTWGDTAQGFFFWYAIHRLNLKYGVEE